MYKVFYFDEVQNDILMAKQWYKEIQKDLGERFANAVKETISSIVKMPFAYALRYKNVRIAHTRIFPYNIHFYIDETKSHIVVIGIIHNKRDDALFLNR
jgi:mRNA-degrading endonuclease RelE of RelBE toxin-antitoxin system